MYAKHFDVETSQLATRKINEGWLYKIFTLVPHKNLNLMFPVRLHIKNRRNEPWKFLTSKLIEYMNLKFVTGKWLYGNTSLSSNSVCCRDIAYKFSLNKFKNHLLPVHMPERSHCIHRNSCKMQKYLISPHWILNDKAIESIGTISR